MKNLPANLISILGLAVICWNCQHEQGNIMIQDEVCFERDILPIFQASCATTDCHSNQSPANEYILTDYAGISKAVEPFNPSASKAYTVLITNSEDLMPPDRALPENKRQLIRLWILQGALESECPDPGLDIEDDDLDGILNYLDNCVGTYNPDQSDEDGDSIGDLCDDGDNDGFIDIADNCPDLYNPGQEDYDGDGIGNYCDPDSLPGIAGLCFERDIFPIFISTCANTGCHEAKIPVEEFRFTDYSSIIATEFVPGNANATRIYQVITLPLNDKYHMPVLPRPPLTVLQLNNIRDWINQGGLNENCGVRPCDLENITFYGNILPIFQNNCRGCHFPQNPDTVINLITYEDILSISLSGKLESVIKNLYGLKMPVGFTLGDCEIQQIDEWIRNGSPNN